ncbi:cyclin-D4-1-like [Olea europaea subsp. europaea]|uniref:Cyclin-D4-1-like n=1 Tax=Olea europaea subsp. europaea TaxID=158383 RepID=A0A8S0S1D4_OLEEU|nr:cyclin-D4-1-like [Olea europaea subsp. europaea]
MADYKSFECAAPELLCNEETKSAFDDDDDFSDPSIDLMIEKEQEYLPKNDYLRKLRSGELDMSLRKDAFEWISKAHAEYNFGAICFCLAMNYLDRFLSVYDLPRGKTWAIQLVAVACLSIAAKMEEIEVPSTVDLQVGKPKFVFEGRTIRRMELLILSILKWKMLAYTPCNFIDYFLKKINDDKLPSGPLITRSIELVMNTIKGIDFLEFRPSEIAAAVAMYVSGEIQAMNIDKALSGSTGVVKERVVKCLELIQDLTTTSVTSAASNVPQSPNGVLEVACLSYKSDENTVGSCSNSSHTKRRKLDQANSESGEFK